MSVLPRISGREVVATLSKVGYAKDRQKGSHIVLRQLNYPHRRVVVPDHQEVCQGHVASNYQASWDDRRRIQKTSLDQRHHKG